MYYCYGNEGYIYIVIYMQTYKRMHRQVPFYGLNLITFSTHCMNEQKFVQLICQIVKNFHMVVVENYLEKSR